MNEKECSSAILRLTEKLAANPTARLFVPLADEYLRLNQPHEAIVVLTEGLRHHPTYVAARMMLAKTYQREGKTAKSKKEFEEVIRLHPQNVLAYKKLASLCQQEGKLDEAIHVCSKGLAIDPYDKEMKQVLALVEEEISYKEERTLPSFSEVIAPVAPHIFAPDAPIPVPAFPPIDFGAMEEPLQSYTIDEEVTNPSFEELIAPSFAETMEPVLETPPLDFKSAEPAIVVEEDQSEAESVAEISELTFPALELEMPKASPIAEIVEERFEDPLVFTEQTAYNPNALYLMRLREWLVSIQEKGVMAR